MAATSQDLKDFFALSGNNPPVTDAQLDKVQDWLDDVRGLTNSTPDDLVDYIYQAIKEQVLAHQRRTQSVTF